MGVMIAGEFRQLTRNILQRYRQSDEGSRAAGMEWYDTAFTTCEAIGARHGYRPTPVAVALAHLSPRVTWEKNLELLDALLAGKPKPYWGLGRQWETAHGSLRAVDPLATFGTRAHKTRAFAAAILGDRNAVVIDVWAARVAGVEELVIRRPSGYVAVAEAYRRAGRHVDISARDLQAVTWCHVRGRAA